MMEIKYSYKNLSDQESQDVETYSEKKIASLEKHLRHIASNTRRLEIHCEKFPTKHAYDVKLTLHTPRMKFMAEEDDHTIHEAVDFAFDKMKLQIEKEHDKKSRHSA